MLETLQHEIESRVSVNSPQDCAIFNDYYRKENTAIASVTYLVESCRTV